MWCMNSISEKLLPKNTVKCNEENFQQLLRNPRGHQKLFPLQFSGVFSLLSRRKTPLGPRLSLAFLRRMPVD